MEERTLVRRTIGLRTKDEMSTSTKQNVLKVALIFVLLLIGSAAVTSLVIEFSWNPWITTAIGVGLILALTYVVSKFAKTYKSLMR